MQLRRPCDQGGILITGEVEHAGLLVEEMTDRMIGDGARLVQPAFIESDPVQSDQGLDGETIVLQIAVDARLSVLVKVP